LRSEGLNRVAYPADGAESDELAEEGSGSENLGSDDETDVFKKTTRSKKPEDHYMPSASDKSDSDEGEAAVGTDDNGNRRKKVRPKFQTYRMRTEKTWLRACTSERLRAINIYMILTKTVVHL
jgi:hypothetical protein